jgi:hypothetical protein
MNTKTSTIIPKIQVVMFVLISIQSMAQVSDIRVHDPVMIRQDGTYYLFWTGRVSYTTRPIHLMARITLYSMDMMPLTRVVLS